jgi:DNA-binding transcriptional MocR family regulator
MTIWLPRLEQRSGPRYLRIAAALRDDIASGQLAPGTRLPTHRDLAEALGVTVGTVSRAYAEAARQNLISGEIGRGTYVRGEPRPEQSMPEPVEPGDGQIDLSLTRPVVDLEQLGLEQTLLRLARSTELTHLFDYTPNAGLAAHRGAAADWLNWWRGLKATPERVVVTSGGQHGIAVVLTALTQPGDVVLTECLTYPGLKGIAKVLHLQLAPVAMDEHGLVPDSLEAVAVHRGGRLLYTIPTLHNPTTTLMPAERRAEIAALAQRLDLTVLEDDVNGLLLPEAPRPLATWIPERSYVVTSLSKFLAPGLRVGFVLTPEGRAARVAAGVRATSIMTSPLLAELATRWLSDGTVERVVSGQQEEARTRQALAARVLQGYEFEAQPYGFHLWLHLPEPWQTEDYVAQARERGVLLSPASAFVVGRTSPPHAVRVGLGGIRPLARLEEGLRVLADILGRPPGSIFSIV